MILELQQLKKIEVEIKFPYVFKLREDDCYYLIKDEKNIFRIYPSQYGYFFTYDIAMDLKAMLIDWISADRIEDVSLDKWNEMKKKCIDTIKQL